ncbi:hypothetical protein LTR94_037619, partial [Friedmanniomyces endolithicus]
GGEGGRDGQRLPRPGQGDERTARLAGRLRDAGGARGPARRAGRPVGAQGDDRPGRVLGMVYRPAGSGGRRH